MKKTENINLGGYALVIEEDDAAPEVSSKPKSPKKKLYRDMDNRCLGGHASCPSLTYHLNVKEDCRR